MEKHKFIGKNREDAVRQATIALQELEENLIIKEIGEQKNLFSKKVEIEAIERRDIKPYIKELLHDLLKDLGFDAKIEVRTVKEMPVYTIYSNHDSLLIGKNGRNLNALLTVVNQMVKKEIGETYKFILDVSDYKERKEKNLEYLAKRLAREVKESQVEVKMDSMNSYERRIVHNILSKNKYVYTESVGEEPNRAVVIKPREKKEENEKSE